MSEALAGRPVGEARLKVSEEERVVVAYHFNVRENSFHLFGLYGKLSCKKNKRK